MSFGVVPQNPMAFLGEHLINNVQLSRFRSVHAEFSANSLLPTHLRRGGSYPTPGCAIWPSVMSQK